jgi:CRISPR-associated endonuclease/helicase Cas3
MKLAKSFFKFDHHLANLATAAARLHDVGKFSNEFQEYIRIEDEAEKKRKHGKIDHATKGAQVAEEFYKKNELPLPIARILEYVVAGHHAGLANGSAKDMGDRASLEKRLINGKIPQIGDRAGQYDDKPELSMEDIKFLGEGTKDPKDIAFRMSFLIRMVFSALVDADRLDAEWFDKPEREQIRKAYPKLSELSKKLDAHLAELSKNAPDNDLNHHRAEVLQACRNAAELDPGLFTLTVPTGGGKTLSSLAFALKHAIKHGMDRVIYVIPYTSIIEQNAKIFKYGTTDEDKIKNGSVLLGEENVIEHHSNFEEKDKSYRYDGDPEPSPHELACENWDAPIIVTTNVQFFESLFASRGTRCRKLHNIANSVVILDEAQMLPVNLLRPCIEAIRELSERYHTSVVLCTATQPALNKRDDFKFGLDGAREIVGGKAAVEKLYNNLKRVEVEFIGKKTDEELVGLLKEQTQALCIVNTKGHARKLYEELKPHCDKDALFHLSTNLCPAHRSKVFDGLIKPRLKDGLPCIVISTQLVEAGVDIDFPVVYRATAGIDSIAQAAGRCNREGKLKDADGNEIKGRTFVFESEHKIPDVLHSIKQTAEVAEGINRRHKDLLGLDAVEDFFKELFWVKGLDQLDSKKIIESLSKEISKAFFPFRDIAEAFRLIDTKTTAVLIEYDDEARKIADKIRHYDEKVNYRKLYRAAQRYTVSLYQQDFDRVRPALEPTDRGVFILTSAGNYDERLGIVVGDPYKIDQSNMQQ